MVNHEDAVRMLAAERYILEELPAEERDRFEEHLFLCPICARDVEELDRIGQTVRAEGARMPGREEVAVGWWEHLARWWAMPQVGAVSACAMLAMMVGLGLQSWAPGRGPVASGPEILTSYMLVPETRGESLAVELPGASDRVLLEADLPGASGDLRWNLTEAGSGREVLTGTAKAPVKGATLKLLLPAASITSQEYRLTFSAISGGKSYQFRFKTRKN
jgi:hypothetical protein